FNRQQPVLGAWLLAVPNNAPHPNQAINFIQYALEDSQLKLAAEYGNPPPRISILSDPAMQGRYPSFAAQLDSLTRARLRPRTPCWREVERALSKALSTWRENQSANIIEDLKQGLESIQQREGSGCVSQ